MNKSLRWLLLSLLALLLASPIVYYYLLCKACDSARSSFLATSEFRIKGSTMAAGGSLKQIDMIIADRERIKRMTDIIFQSRNIRIMSSTFNRGQVYASSISLSMTAYRNKMKLGEITIVGLTVVMINDELRWEVPDGQNLYALIEDVI